MRLWDIIFPCMSSENLQTLYKKFHRNLSRRIPSNLSVFTLICAQSTFDYKLYGNSVGSELTQVVILYRTVHDALTNTLIGVLRSSDTSLCILLELRNRSILEFSYMRIILIWSSITHFQSNVKGFFVFFLTILTK